MRLNSVILTAAFIGSTIAAVVAWRAAGATRSAKLAREQIEASQERTSRELAQANESSGAFERARSDAEGKLAALRARPVAPAADSSSGKPKMPLPAPIPVKNPGEVLAKDPRLQVIQL